ncbi:DUF393 domain-containing protein [Paracoccus sp. 11-3]|uniref:DUF393 domain-containing protein n=1 Tax=Paracoccus amoyensis TaxID=2760093 RepID=A0A926GB98_9RHOB|nr:DCC1-like thiol-disulfide oxidoreductase family protein [Paracoccus amoyensis]MBC9246801.1 DUF393 domain-containing protein [Paracoccus amoyensis]
MSIEIFYDGECPFCSAYVRMLNLQRNVGQVDLIDMRANDPRFRALVDDGLNPNAGMVVRYGQTNYVGAEAVRILSILSQNGGAFTWLMRSPHRAAIIYPVLRACRNGALRLLGRKQIT